MKAPCSCAMCGAKVIKLKDECIVGTLVYCTPTCRNLHLPSEHRRVRSLLLKALSVPRKPEALRALLVEALQPTQP